MVPLTFISKALAAALILGAVVRVVANMKTTGEDHRVFLNHEAEVFRKYVEWDDNDSESLIAAAENFGNHHASSIPHPQERGNITFWHHLQENAKLFMQIGSESLKRDENNNDNELKALVDNIFARVVELQNKFEQWPAVWVWSAARRLSEDVPAHAPKNSMLVHRGYDFSAFFIADVIGEGCDWSRFPTKMDQHLFFEIYCAKRESLVPSGADCTSRQYQETLRIEASLFSLPVHMFHGLENTLKALQPSNGRGMEDFERKRLLNIGYKHLQRYVDVERMVLLNLAHAGRAKEIFANEIDVNL